VLFRLWLVSERHNSYTSSSGSILSPSSPWRAAGEPGMAWRGRSARHAKTWRGAKTGRGAWF